MGDVREVLAELLSQLEATQTRTDAEALAAWMNRIDTWKAKKCLHYKVDAAKPILAAGRY